jgi:hypothetical protein
MASKRNPSATQKHEVHHRSSNRRSKRIISSTKEKNRLIAIWKRYHLSHEPWPILGAALAGGTGIAVTSAIGLSELAVGLALSYAVFRTLREGINPRVAFRQGIRLERKAADGTPIE